MSLSSMTEAVSRHQLESIAGTVFVQKFVSKSKKTKQAIDDIQNISEEEAKEVTQVLFDSRYRAVHDIAIAINEFLDRSGGGIPLTLTKEVEWLGYINGTEEPVRCLMTEGTTLNFIEFLEAPSEGLIFQLCLGEGENGKHFNINMDAVLDSSDDLIELVQMAQNQRVEDALNGIDTDFLGKTNESE